MTTYGHKLDGTPVTGEMVQAWADEAEPGYTPDQLQPARRAVGRPAIGSAAASVKSPARPGE